MTDDAKTPAMELGDIAASLRETRRVLAETTGQLLAENAHLRAALEELACRTVSLSDLTIIKAALAWRED